MTTGGATEQLFDRRYDPDTYNCAHLVEEAWRLETGQDISGALSSFLLPRNERGAPLAVRRRFRNVSHAESPCVVLMHRGRTAPHVGIYLRGRVLQITENGVERMPLHRATRGFSRVTFHLPVVGDTE